MKKNQVTIKIDRRGTLSGSAAYVSEKLASAKVYQKGNGIFVEYSKGKDKDGNDVMKKEKICGVMQSPSILENAREYNRNIWVAYPYDEDFGCGYEKYCLFDCVLTSKGSEIAEEFLQKCAAELYEIFKSE